MGHHISCSQCDLIHKIPPVATHANAYCVRCGAELFRSRPDTINRSIAWTLSSAVLFLVAVSFPFIALVSQGVERQTGLLTGVYEIYMQGMTSLAILVALTCVVSPIIQMLGLLYVLLPLRFNRTFPHMESVLRLFQQIRRWNMMEVFLLGILVALVKLSDIATIVPGIAVYAFALLTVCHAFAVSSVDAFQVWKQIERLRYE